jgi:hypothetical protein
MEKESREMKLGGNEIINRGFKMNKTNSDSRHLNNYFKYLQLELLVLDLDVQLDVELPVLDLEVKN